MKIFLSWSGEQSKSVAESLSSWLGDVIHSARPWMSEHDIQAGSRWSASLGTELQESHFGVICLTGSNLDTPWLLFEAGCLAKSLEEGLVVPYRLGISATDVKPPLSQFQGVDATQAGTLRLVESINRSVAEPLPRERLNRMFEKFWPDLESALATAENLDTEVVRPSRETDDYLAELLELVREMSRRDKRSGGLEGALAILKESLPEAEVSVAKVEEYSKTGGGRDLPDFQRAYDRQYRRRDAIREAIAALEGTT